MENVSVMYVNSNFVKETGIAKTNAVGKSMYDLFEIVCVADNKREAIKKEVYDAVIKGINDFSVDGAYVVDGQSIRCRLVFHSVCSEQLFEDSYIIGAPISVAEVDSPFTDKIDLSKMAFVKMYRLEGESEACQSRPIHYSSIAPGGVPKDLPIQLGAPIGKGSYGTVYRGLWRGKEVAVKVMPTESVIAEEGYDPKGEAELTKRLSHPNLVSAYDHFEVTHPTSGEKEIWMLLELCEMGTLSSQIVNGFFRRKEGNWALDMSRILRIAHQLASVLAFIHGQGVIHSDLTTNNVLLVKDSSPEGFSCKLSDFGIAQTLPGDEDYITTEAHGTVTHMPPELLMDCKLSTACDVYSFGMILWELYHSQRPFDGMLHAQVIAHVALKNVRPDIEEDCPEDYRQMIEECWDADDEERPTVEALKMRLAGMIANER